MIFTEPTPFAEALQNLSGRGLMPTSASSAQLATLSPELRERALFSARTTNAKYLQKIDDVLQRLISPESITDPDSGLRRPARPGEYMDDATARLELKQTLTEIGYEPDRGRRGGLQDLSSDIRLDLVIDTNRRMIQGYGYWQQGQDPTVLDQWPAQELFRAEMRDEERDWFSRWRNAGGKLYDGRMIAVKNAPIWSTISAFGIPYPPFDWFSGMDVMDVDRDEAVRLGVIDKNTKVQPQARPVNEDLEAGALDPQSALQAALLKSLGDRVSFSDGVLHLK